jgi:ribose transport system substrate-binding protein
VRIYVLLPSLEDESYTQQRTGALAASEDVANVEVEVEAGTSRGTSTDLMAKIDSAVTQGFDAIAINTGAVGEELAPAVERAQSQGTKIVTFDQSVPGADVASFIEFDGVENGRLMGEYMKKQLPDGGEVGIIDCFSENPLIRAINDGIRSGLQGSAIKVVARLDARCDPSRARNAAENMLSAHPDLKGIFAEWDVAALGAIKAIEQSNDPVILIGGGAQSDALEIIARGNTALKATTNAQFERFGYLAVETAAAAARNQPVERSIKVEPALVTKDNVSELLAQIKRDTDE